MNTKNTNWQQSVTAVVIKDNKVLLARHTYGRGAGKLIIPGGYVEYSESPQSALIREFREETNITISPKEIIGIRFNMHDWYIAFSADYVDGIERTDNDENSEVLWLDVDDALNRSDVPYLTKSLIKCALSGKGLRKINYEGSHMPCSLYGITE